MSSNSLVKNSVLIGGLTFLGYLAGGKLGSMLGAAIGTVVCTIFNQDTVFNDRQLYSNYPDYTIDTTPKTNVSERQKHLESKRRNESIKISICSICLEEFIPSIVLIPCKHSCFCEDCFLNVQKKKITKCPVCRELIFKFRNIS